MSHKVLADHLGVRADWVQAWEIPSRRCNPTQLQQIALSKLVEVSPQQLAQMLPCYTGFRIPALWEEGCCEYCGLPFSQMQDELD